MAKHSGKLTKTAVDAWEYQPDDPILWDGKLTGFGVKANRGGSKSYIVNYKNKYNVERRYTIGKHGGKLTADAARGKADKLLARIRLEQFDPLADKQTTRTALSVNQLLDEYLLSAKFAQKTPATQYSDKGRINRHLRPTLGKLKVEQVTPERVRRAFADIRDGKTAATEKTKKRGKSIVRGGDGVARMSIRNLRAIFNWAIAERIMISNPASGIEIGSDGERDTILETPQQYAALFAALDKLETERRISDAVADCIRVLALTGARRGEITGMRWQYVNLEKALVTIPPSAHKTGRRTGKPKEIALTEEALAIIARRPRDEPDSYVFPPGKGDTPLALSSKQWALIRSEAGLPDGITNHSLRHSLGSLMAVQGAEAAQLMTQLGHSQLSTTKRYIHFAQNAKAALAEKYTASISEALQQAKAGASNVVKLPARGKAK